MPGRFREADTLIFVLFLVPLAVYFLVLGWINRQPRPVVVSGIWDFVGILFAASGFILLGGPAALSGLNERWRTFWLLGQGNPTSEGLDELRQVWLFLAALYFFVVVGVSAWVLWRRRGTTCIYNTEPALVDSILVDTCESLGLHPVHSGNIHVFGMLGQNETSISPEKGLPNSAILEVESFEAMNHVTLRWDPPDSPLRGPLEEELAKRLMQTEAPEHETGAWLGIVGSTLLLVSLFGLIVVCLRVILQR